MPFSIMPQKSTRPSFWSLKVDDDDLKEQVEEYSTLKLSQSYRGMSFIAVAFSMLMTFVVAVPLHMLTLPDAIIDLVTYGFFATFMLRGHRWALIALMVLWTADKGYQLASGANPIGVLLWWAGFMMIFWKALLVENARRKKPVAAPAMASSVPPAAP